MRVLNYLEFETRLKRSGIATATAQQRSALKTMGVDVVRWPLPDDSIWSNGADLFRSKGPFSDIDVVHCNGIGPGSALLVSVARFHDIPSILHAHVTGEDFAESFRGSSMASGPLKRYLQWFYSRSDLVLCPSEYTRHTLEQYPVNAPIRSITNGVDIESLDGFEAFRSEYRDRYDLEDIVVFTVGNVFERKGLTTFCRLATATNFEFVWFGPYDEGPHASTIVRTWTTNPPTNCTFTGWIPDIRGAYAAGDIFCFPSKVENQGIAVLEAMACGKPVVLRDIPPFEEYFTHGKDCLKCGTFEEFQTAIEALASDRSMRDRLGENARGTAAKHGLDNVGPELLLMYDCVIGSDS